MNIVGTIMWSLELLDNQITKGNIPQTDKKIYNYRGSSNIIIMYNISKNSLFIYLIKY